MLKEIIRIANLLDEKGLRKEASALDSLLEKIAEYDDMDDYYDDELSEDAKGAISSFIKEHLNAAPPEEDPDSSKDPATNVAVSDMLYNRSEDLKIYIEEHLTDKIFELSDKIGMRADKFYKEIVDEAKFSEKYSEDEDFAYLIDAVKFYLDDYQF